MVNKQEYLNAITQDIEMVRGDTLVFNFQLSGLGSRQAYEDLIVAFSVAEEYDETAIFKVTKDNGIELADYENDTATFTVSVAPEMTEGMDLARYFYTLQIKDDSDVVTLMMGRLTLIWDIE